MSFREVVVIRNANSWTNFVKFKLHSTHLIHPGNVKLGRTLLKLFPVSRNRAIKRILILILCSFIFNIILLLELDVGYRNCTGNLNVPLAPIQRKKHIFLKNILLNQEDHIYYRELIINCSTGPYLTNCLQTIATQRLMATTIRINLGSNLLSLLCLKYEKIWEYCRFSIDLVLLRKSINLTSK